MKVLITPRSFGKEDPAPLALLEHHGLRLVRNDTGGILDEAKMRRSIDGCDGVIVGVDPLGEAVLSAAPGLRAVAKYGVGTDNIDLAYCARHGIAVSKTTGANSEAVADYAFALMAALARSVSLIDRGCRRGDWTKITTSDLSRKRLGLIGLGAIGREVVRRASGFSMEVLAHDVRWDEDYARESGVRRADVDTICRECDFISLHLPLLSETRGLISGARIALMKPTAYLINTARGGLIDEEALLDALRHRRIAGAGLDAFEREPPENPAWFSLDNVLLGSHCAASTTGAARRMSMMAAENLLRDLGVPRQPTPPTKEDSNV